MKTLHFAPTLQPGSSTRLAADLPYALQAYGGQSWVVSPEAEQLDYLLPPGIERPAFRPPALLGRWGRVRRLRQLLEDIKPDILHAYGSEGILTAARACRHLPRRSRPRLVGTLTGHPATPAFLHSPELQSCACLTIISKHLRRELKKHNPALIKSWVIPYGVDEALCYPGYQPTAEWQHTWDTEHPELAGRFVLCLPGPISPQHGTEDTLPILTTLLRQEVPAHCLIAGDTSRAPAAYLSRLRRSIRSAGLDRRITFIGARPDLRDILTRAHAVLHLAAAPAAYDRPALEALALGRPVVGYAHGIIGEYLETFNPVGAVPPGNTAAAADVLSQWHSSPPDALPGIPYPYRLADTAKTYHDLYTSLLS